MIETYLDQAVEELKRVEHLVYVSLKYTRTVDVLLNIISRMIDGYDEMWNALLEWMKEKGDLEEIPTAPVVKANVLLDYFEENDEVVDNARLFLLLRKLHRSSNPEREQEYRRHVTMRTIIDGREELLNIDIVTQYFHMQKDFLHTVQLLIYPEMVDKKTGSIMD